MKYLVSLFILFFAISNLWSQDLDEQYKTLKEESETFKTYKVIDQKLLDQFWSITMDSVTQIKSEQNRSLARIEEQADTIKSLNSTILEKDGSIAELEKQTSTIEVVGLPLNKKTFIFISFITIGALLIVLAYFIYQYKDNLKVARSKVKEYEKLNYDFEEYKRNALEKQMKLRRDLQTERNKLEEVRNT